MKAFECKMCGTCCFGEGGIYLQKEERDRIARFLDMTPESFEARFCRKKNGRLYITTGPDKFCIFFDKEKQCLIHPVKPRPCYSWPFFPANIKDEDSWKLAQDACPGINPNCTFEEFVKQSSEE